jgi:hypothetical protein
MQLKTLKWYNNGKDIFDAVFMDLGLGIPLRSRIGTTPTRM